MPYTSHLTGHWETARPLTTGPQSLCRILDYRNLLGASPVSPVVVVAHLVAQRLKMIHMKVKKMA